MKRNLPLAILLVLGATLAGQCLTPELAVINACVEHPNPNGSGLPVESELIIFRNGFVPTPVSQVGVDLPFNGFGAVNADVGVGVNGTSLGCAFKEPSVTALRGCPQAVPLGPGGVIPPGAFVVFIGTGTTNTADMTEIDFTPICQGGNPVVILQNACERTSGTLANGPPASGDPLRSITVISPCGPSTFSYNTNDLDPDDGTYYLVSTNAVGNLDCDLPSLPAGCPATDFTYAFCSPDPTLPLDSLRSRYPATVFPPSFFRTPADAERNRNALTTYTAPASAPDTLYGRTVSTENFCVAIGTIVVEYAARPDTLRFTDTICPGSSVEIEGRSYSLDNPTDTLNFPDRGVCGSTIIVALTVRPPVPPDTVDVLLCNGSEYLDSLTGSRLTPAEPELLTVLTTAEGCRRERLLRVDFNDFSVAILPDPPPPVLNCDSTVLSLLASVADGRPPFTFAWTNGATDDRLTDLGPGVYGVVVTDARGCVAEDQIELLPPPENPIRLPPSLTLVRGDSLVLDLTLTSEVATIRWVPDVVRSGPNFVVAPRQTTTYTVTVQTPAGCAFTASTRVVVDQPVRPDARFYAPTAFSPNDDGINDVFVPLLTDDVVVIEQFRIYDRWGGEVARPQVQWDGWKSSEPAEPGLYLYYVRARLADGRMVELRGEVNLVR